ncbi:hypothetical protein EE612_033276, partial [Oryza sativa]
DWATLEEGSGGATPAVPSPPLSSPRSVRGEGAADAQQRRRRGGRVRRHGSEEGAVVAEHPEVELHHHAPPIPPPQEKPQIQRLVSRRICLLRGHHQRRHHCRRLRRDHHCLHCGHHRRRREREWERGHGVVEVDGRDAGRGEDAAGVDEAANPGQPRRGRRAVEQRDRGGIRRQLRPGCTPPTPPSAREDAVASDARADEVDEGMGRRPGLCEMPAKEQHQPRGLRTADPAPRHHPRCR